MVGYIIYEYGGLTNDLLPRSEHWVCPPLRLSRCILGEKGETQAANYQDKLIDSIWKETYAENRQVIRKMDYRSL